MCLHRRPLSCAFTADLDVLGNDFSRGSGAGAADVDVADDHPAVRDFYLLVRGCRVRREDSGRGQHGEQFERVVHLCVPREGRLLGFDRVLSKMVVDAMRFCEATESPSAWPPLDGRRYATCPWAATEDWREIKRRRRPPRENLSEGCWPQRLHSYRRFGGAGFTVQRQTASGSAFRRPCLRYREGRE